MNPALRGYHTATDRYVMGVNLPTFLFWRRYDSAGCYRETKMLARWEPKGLFFESIVKDPPESLRILLRRLNQVKPGYKPCYNCCSLGHWLQHDSEYLTRDCPTCKGTGQLDRMTQQEILI